MEQVAKFKYLGSWISADGRCEAEIRSRIGGKRCVQQTERITQKMSKCVKKRIVKAVVWSIALYGAETWTLRKEDVGRLSALEMWLWRRMEKISWKDKKTNEEVLKAVGENRNLVDRIIH